MTNDGPSVTSYQGGLNLRDPHEALKGHVGASAVGESVKLDFQLYSGDGSGLVTAFHTVTPEEASELAAALQFAARAARQSRYEQLSERIGLGATG